MEQLLNVKPVSYARCMMNCCEESGFNGDYTLPEYCYDIASVLTCVAEPRLQNRQYSSGRLLLEGVVNLRVIYVDENRSSVHSVEFSCPYSCSIAGNETGEDPLATFDLETKYVNCRVISPRRLEVHGAVKVHMKAFGNQEGAVTIPTKNRGLCVLCETVPYSHLADSSEKIITISETLEFPVGLPAAEMLLGGMCSAQVKEWKVLRGKVIAKGVLQVHQLYTDNQELGDTHCLDYEIPFSQVLDVPNAHEGYLCHGEVMVLTDIERCLVGPDGANTMLEMTAKVLLQVLLYKTEEITVLKDTYHTNYPVEVARNDVEYRAFCGSKYEKTILPILSEVPEKRLQDVIDLWVQPINTSAVIQQDTIKVSGEIRICALCKTLDGEVVYFEKDEAYCMEFIGEGNEIIAKVMIDTLRYRVVDNKFEIHAELCVAMHQYQVSLQSVIQSLNLNEAHPFAKDQDSAVLYYAQPGESIWEIGRDCHTTPAMIHEENGIEMDEIDKPCVLMIPIA